MNGTADLGGSRSVSGRDPMKSDRRTLMPGHGIQAAERRSPVLGRGRTAYRDGSTAISTGSSTVP